jgi:organic hydroperoxide reductase OsmC/OhrA
MGEEQRPDQLLVGAVSSCHQQRMPVPAQDVGDFLVRQRPIELSLTVLDL